MNRVEAILNNPNETRQLIFETIQLLHNEKQRRRIKPDHVLRSEILKFIQNKIDRALQSLEQEGKIKSGKVMNYFDKYFVINE